MAGLQPLARPSGKIRTDIASGCALIRNLHSLLMNDRSFRLFTGFEGVSCLPLILAACASHGCEDAVLWFALVSGELALICVPLPFFRSQPSSGSRAEKSRLGSGIKGVLQFAPRVRRRRIIRKHQCHLQFALRKFHLLRIESIIAVLCSLRHFSTSSPKLYLFDAGEYNLNSH